jgi:arylformamidase
MPHDIGQLAAKPKRNGTPIAEYEACAAFDLSAPDCFHAHPFESSRLEIALTAFDVVPEEVPGDPRRSWSKLDQAARNAAYDNNAAVADSAALIEERNAASAAFRAMHARALDVPYAKDERTRFDLYPADDPAAPCLVFIHGGYWQRNSREAFAMLAEGALATGWSVAMPGYSLAPAATLARIADEISLALDWLSDAGSSHGIAGPVVVSGWSAGAQLAALALRHPRVAAGLAISGVYDLAPIRDTHLNQALQISEQEIAALSPLRLAVTPKPLAIAYGTAELPALIWDSRRLHARRAAAHAAGPLIPVAGANHFTILDALRRRDGLLLQAAGALLGGCA